MRETKVSALTGQKKKCKKKNKSYVKQRPKDECFEVIMRE